MLGSATGLVAVTYGLIEAGENGWGTAGAALPMIAGALLLIGFFGRERLLGGPQLVAPPVT